VGDGTREVLVDGVVHTGPLATTKGTRYVVTSA
jgi:hypothetical protein